MPSFYVHFAAHTTEIIVRDDECHHIANVFRHKVGDVIPVINGCGNKGFGEILSIKKKELALQLRDISFVQKPSYRVGCAFSLLKNKNDFLIVEKLTELGVNDLFPMTTKYSVKQSKENTAEKMQKVAISAAKQCDNAWLPVIHPVQDLKSSLARVIASGYSPIVASEMRPENTISGFLSNAICVFIGSEGGFDESEFALFTENDIPQVMLSQNILRAETAAICAVSQITLLLMSCNL